jgi:hypothetical protein
MLIMLLIRRQDGRLHRGPQQRRTQHQIPFSPAPQISGATQEWRYRARRIPPV